MNYLIESYKGLKDKANRFIPNFSHFNIRQNCVGQVSLMFPRGFSRRNYSLKSVLIVAVLCAWPNKAFALYQVVNAGARNIIVELLTTSIMQWVWLLLFSSIAMTSAMTHNRTGKKIFAVLSCLTFISIGICYGMGWGTWSPLWKPIVLLGLVIIACSSDEMTQ